LPTNTFIHVLFIINIVHGLQDRQEQKHSKTQQNMWTVVCKTK